MRILAVALAAICCVGCDHESNQVGREPDEYLGCATDELWEVFDQNEGKPVVDAAAAPKLSAPILTLPLASLSAPIFVWSKNPATASAPDGDVPITCPQFSRGAIGTKHFPSVSGTVYQLRIYEAQTNVYRVLTTLEQWQPPASAWQRLAGKSLRFEIMGMSVASNGWSAGPYVSPDVMTFTVEGL